MGRLGITGTPGTGKKTVSSLVASRLGFSVVDLNSLALYGKRPEQGETLEADTRELRRRLKKLSLEDKVVYGHLLPDVLREDELDFVAVLRCNPDVLKRRLLARDYSPEKLRENLEAELIGVTLDESLKRFGKDRVHEYDGSRTEPEGPAKMIASDFLSHSKQRQGWIDWLKLYNSSRKLKSLLSTDKMESALT